MKTILQLRINLHRFGEISGLANQLLALEIPNDDSYHVKDTIIMGWLRNHDAEIVGLIKSFRGSKEFLVAEFFTDGSCNIFPEKGNDDAILLELTFTSSNGDNVEYVIESASEDVDIKGVFDVFRDKFVEVVMSYI